MRKSIKKFILSALVAIMCLAPSSCIRVFDQDVQIVHLYQGGNQTTPSNGAILFGNYTPATKAVAGVGPNEVGYDSFKIYGFEDETPIMDPFQVTWQNSAWVYDGIGTQELKYFNRNANSYTFIGVISDKVPGRTDQVVNVESIEAFQTDDVMNSPKEFLYTQKIVEPDQYGQYVNLTFNHANARMHIGFASDRNDTEIVDYVSGFTGTPGTLTTEHAKMFDLLAEGKRVGYGLTKFQGDEHGEYRGYTGNYFNINPYLGGLSYITNERLAELMPLVNAQFIYTDENNNIVDHWEYGVDKKDKMFLKFAEGVNGADFIAGNDAFWTNLTAAEKTGLQNHHDSGCRIIRIDRLPDGNYFAWGESYGLVQNTTARDFKVMTGGTVGISDLEGIRVFSVDDSGEHNIHLAHVDAADAHVSITGTPTFDNLSTSTNVMLFSHPNGAVAQVDNTSIVWADATPSPTVRYALPVNNTGYVVKFSYIYNGITYYDARVLIPTASAAFVESKDYTYVVYITDRTNATTDPEQAHLDKDEVDTNQKAIVFSEVTFGDYSNGGHYVYSIL